ncbi:MAG: two-component regulator propeller domain-containing protein [Ignavibacteriaceae bacterium]
MKLLAVFILFITTILPQNNNLKFTHITTDDGLSQSNVKCIMQDHLGFLWFGTFDGLNKYDGYSFTVYKPDQNDSNALKSNSISCLLEDNSGIIWIGTDQGLCCYDRNKNKFKSFTTSNYPDAIINSEIGGLAIDKKQNLWIAASKGIIIYNRSEKTFKKINDLYAKAAYVDKKGNVWIGTASNGLNLVSSDKINCTPFSIKERNGESKTNYEVRTITEDKKGILWVGTYGYGLAYTSLNNLSDKSLSNFINDPQNAKSISNNLILSLYPDNNGGLWIGTENGGINYLPQNSKHFFHFKNDPDVTTSLNNNSIYSIYKDNSGDLWFGTFSGGINYVNNINQVFNCYRNIPGNSRSLATNAVRDFAETKDGNIWVATDGGGLDLFNTGTNVFKHFNTSNTNLNREAVLTVFIDSKNRTWIGTWDGGLSLFDENRNYFKSFTKENSSIQSNNVFDIDEDKYGNLWLATTDGLAMFNPNTEFFTTYSEGTGEIPVNHLEEVVVDSKGNILGGTTQGLSVYNPVTKKTFTYTSNKKNSNSLSANFITAIYEDGIVLWVGTIDGFNKIDREKNIITRYSEKNGLPNNSIRGIEKDNNGFLWISTNKGISKFDPRKKSFKNYTKQDGIQGNEYVINSFYKTRQGKILFGGVNGFDYFDPEKVKDNKYIPPVVITDFQIFNKKVIPGLKDSPLKKDISETKNITLTYKESVFSFHFTAFNYRASDKNQYAYKLDGFDKDWNKVGNIRSASYTNLDPGEYVFRVKGSNNDGVWNDKGASISIIITPPFWATWWFRLLIILALSGTVYYMINRAIKKRKSLEEINKKLEDEIRLNKEAEEENSRLAAEGRKKDEEAKKVLQEQHAYLQNGFDILLSHMNRFSEGDLGSVINTESNDSFARLFAGFNKAVENFRKIILNLVNAIQSTAEASNQINSSAQEIANGTSEQSSRSEEVVSAVEQMTYNLNSSSKNSETAAKVSIKATQTATEGGEIVNKTIKGMAEISNVVNDVAGTIKKLEVSSNEIGEIVELINEIADQTNLLALNAAIEAARAGEHGRGFAVVADEVQKLSERTTSATKNIAEMIKQIQLDSKGAIKSISLSLDKVNNGREYAKQAGVSLDNIIKSITEVSQIIEQVAAANEEQSAGVQHINESILLINDVSKDNASRVNQVTSAIWGLRNLTEDLQKIINKFNINSEKIVNEYD